jgi:hypothetical protein
MYPQLIVAARERAWPSEFGNNLNLNFKFMRPLTLHVSALSDAEYTFYTSAISDLAVASGDDSQHNNAYYENLSVGVREARAWLRGRFSDLPVSDIDVVSLTSWLTGITRVAQCLACLGLETISSEPGPHRFVIGRTVFCCTQAGSTRPGRQVV